MGIKGLGTLTFGAALLGTSVCLAAPEDAGCLGESALVRAHWDEIARPEPGNPVPLGTFLLPLSASHPEIITAARLTLTLENDLLQVTVTFNDPKPFGLPFNFEGLRITYEDDLARRQEARLDWSDSCQGVGRSLFPGQSFQDQLRLSDLPLTLRNVSLFFWGARN